MNEQHMNKISTTDWARIDAMTDDDIDTSDIPPLTDEFFKRASVRMPKQVATMTVQVDADVLNWFKALGDQYEQRVNAALRMYAEAHKVARR